MFPSVRASHVKVLWKIKNVQLWKAQQKTKTNYFVTQRRQPRRKETILDCSIFVFWKVCTGSIHIVRHNESCLWRRCQSAWLLTDCDDDLCCAGYGVGWVVRWWRCWGIWLDTHHLVLLVVEVPCFLELSLLKCWCCCLLLLLLLLFVLWLRLLRCYRCCWFHLYWMWFLWVLLLLFLLCSCFSCYWTINVLVFLLLMQMTRICSILYWSTFFFWLP